MPGYTLVLVTIAIGGRSGRPKERSMENLPQGLEGPLWKHFLELSRIPRGSKHEAAAADWVADQARGMGCEVSRDAAGNVIIRKQASIGRETAKVTALQAHVDMVCEKNEGTVHDFLTDPIVVVREGDLIRAKGTTLGADDGIGVAAALAVLEDRTLVHGPLEVLITVDEETGLTGAAQLRPGTLKADYLLNLDTGKAGYLTIGCSGGLESRASRRVRRLPATPGKAGYRLKVSGLKGGHSGGQIDAGRGNAIRILARALWTLVPGFGLELVSLSGGNKRNAIPREAFAGFRMDPGREADLRAALVAMEADMRTALGSFDPGVGLALDAVDLGDAQVMDPQDARTVVNFLFTVMHGAVARSPVLSGLTQTSSNLAIVTTGAEGVEVCLSHRSSLESSKRAVADQVSALCELAGFEWSRDDGYPGWVPDPEAPLVRAVQAVHASVFGEPMVIKATHGGLECGLIGAGHPGMQMVSFGPDMWDNHTPDERVSIASVAGFWKLLTAVLEGLSH
jgi:dipeptidase D